MARVLSAALRIFVATDSNPNPKGLAESSIWERNLLDPLRDLGHEVIRFAYDLRPFSLHANPAYPADRAWQAQHRPRLEEELLHQVRQRHNEHGLDLFFSYFWDAHATPGTIQTIRQLGIPTVNWFCNGSFQMHMVEQLAPAYDYCLVPEKFRLPDYRALGANPIYFQEAANPNFYRPLGLPRDIPVSFVGQCYGDRVNYAAALHRAGIPLSTYGPNWVERAREDATLRRRWQRWGPVRSAREWSRRLRGKTVVRRDPVPAAVAHPPLSDEAMVALYSRSQISLGFSTCGDTDKGGGKILQVRLRDMEAPMCGAFYLVERFDELAEFFEYGREIEGYSDEAELVDKVRFYLRHDRERETIRAAGHRRALAEHTWQRRFSRLFKEIGLLP